MNNFTKNLIRIFVLVGFSFIAFFACQKAEPSPYSTPTVALTHTITPIDTGGRRDTTKPAPPDTNPSFKAAINGGSVMAFTPSKIIAGANTSLKGVSTYYTLTIKFPTAATGPGHYSIGFGGTPGITVALVNGGTTYVVNNNWGSGDMQIDSISAKGKYYGTFDLDPQDSVSFNSIIVSQGSFYHL
jgi:hypothetical protein